MRSLQITAAALCGGLAVSAAPALAATVTTSFAVSLTVQNECVIEATPLVFGTLSLVANGGLATSTITVTCTSGTPFTIGLDAGSGPGASLENRLLQRQGAGGTGTVGYTIFRDGGRSQLWGNTEATLLNGGTASGQAQTFNVYGAILSGQSTAPAGDYTDTVGVTIFY